MRWLLLELVNDRQMADTDAMVKRMDNVVKAATLNGVVLGAARLAQQQTVATLVRILDEAEDTSIPEE